MQVKMDKTVGKYCTFFLLLFFVQTRTEVALRALNMQGEPLARAGTGQPFTLEVTMHGVGRSLQAPTIKGVKQFEVKRNGLYMSSINGKSTTKFSYKIRIDEPGSYEIGPAIVHDHGNKIESNILTVAVDYEPEQRVVGKKKRDNSSKQKALLRLSVDTDHVVVGQKVLCKIRFYYRDPSIELKHIGQPEIVGATIKGNKGPQAGTARIDGVMYHFAEWWWNLYPSKTGTLIIPAYSADFTTPSKHDHVFGGFSILLGPRTERKKIYSNAVKLKVDQMPAYDGPVHAVGNFERIHASVKPAVAKEGEGMVLTLEIEGDGNLDEIAVPTLRGMPNELKYYDSNSSIVEPTHEGALPKKQFEYIVQGLACGDWEIPQQLFTFFDVTTRSYKTLHTVPQMVAVLPRATVTQAIGPIDTEPPEDQLHISPLNTKGPWYLQTERTPLPWWVFHLLTVIPMLCWFVPRLKNRLLVKIGTSKKYSKKKAFSHARAQLSQAKVNGDPSCVYQIFVQLIADRYGQLSAKISPDIIEHQLRSAGISDSVIIMWDAFFKQATELAFGVDKNKQSLEAFFELAEQWINQFEKFL